MGRKVVFLFFLGCGAFSLSLACLFGACDQANRPIDAETRRQIDSIAAVRIKEAHEEIDSLCKEQHNTLLPLLADSLKEKRLREIQEKLKTAPK